MTKRVSPSLPARKVPALLISKAGGEAWREGAHAVTKKEMGGSHTGKELINGGFDELMDVKIKMSTIRAVAGMPSWLLL